MVRILSFLAALALALPATAQAQMPEASAPSPGATAEAAMPDDAPPGGPDGSTDDQPVWITQSANSDPLGLIGAMDEDWSPAPELYSAIDRYLLEEYRARTLELRHRNAVFNWHRASSQMIFVMVLAVVAAGLVFSWMQFRRGLEDGATPEVTTVEASKTGVKLSSPVLGVIILAMSLGFFYLYLIHVYPVRVL